MQGGGSAQTCSTERVLGWRCRASAAARTAASVSPSSRCALTCTSIERVVRPECYRQQAEHIWSGGCRDRPCDGGERPPVGPGLVQALAATTVPEGQHSAKRAGAAKGAAGLQSRIDEQSLPGHDLAINRQNAPAP